MKADCTKAPAPPSSAWQEKTFRRSSHQGNDLSQGLTSPAHPLALRIFSEGCRCVFRGQPFISSRCSQRCYNAWYAGVFACQGSCSYHLIRYLEPICESFIVTVSIL